MKDLKQAYKTIEADNFAPKMEISFIDGDKREDVLDAEPEDETFDPYTADDFLSDVYMDEARYNTLKSLLLTKKNSEEEIINYFLNKCSKMGIEISPKNVAVLTRGRIYSDTDITGLWKSKEIELFAKAAYEWKFGK